MESELTGLPSQAELKRKLAKLGWNLPQDKDADGKHHGEAIPLRQLAKAALNLSRKDAAGDFSNKLQEGEEAVEDYEKPNQKVQPEKSF